MQNFTKVLAIALLSCHGCAFVPALVSTSSEEVGSPSAIPGCLSSLPNLPVETIRKWESSKNVETEADILGALGKGREALNKYSEAHTLYFAELGRGVGRAWGHGDLSAAMEVNRSPETPEFLLKVGSAFAQADQHQVAIGCFTEALNQRIESPKDASVYMNRGDSYAQIGGGENARQDYQKSADLFEKYELPQYKQIALNKLNQTPNKNKPGVVIPAPQSPVINERYKKTCYAEALTGSEGRKITESSDNLEIVADKLAASGKHKEAIRKYHEASAAAMNEAIADGTTLEMEIDTLLLGKSDFESKYRQRSAESSFKIGSSYARIGEYEKAIDCFDGTLKAGILPPNDAITYLNRGDAYERIGNKAKAKADFQQAVTLFKKHKQPTYQKSSEQRLKAVK